MPVTIERKLPPLAAKGPAARAYVPHQTRTPACQWYLAVDLGQRQDHSSIAVLDLAWIYRGQSPLNFAHLFEPQLTLRSLERIPLGTCYEELHLILADYLQELEYRIAGETNRAAPAKELIIDAGGPGPPMVDRLRHTLRGSAKVTPVIITGGKGANTLAGGYVGIPRRTIISRLIQMISGGTITCPPGLQGWRQFVQEMLDINGDTMKPDSSGGHDDLVIATGLAAWAAARDIPELVPGARTNSDFHRNNTCGFVEKRLI